MKKNNIVNGNMNNVQKQLLKHIILNVLGMLGLSGYILADTFFVSKGLGANGIAALNLAIPVYSFVHGSGLMIGMGAGTKYSIFRGQNNYRSGNKVFTVAMLLAGITAVIYVILGVAVSGNICSILGARGEVYDMTYTYIKIILIASPGFILNDVIVCFVRNDGKPGLSMAAMLTGSMANILLDYIFIFPLKLGIFGAVLATSMSPCISLAVLSLHFKGGRNGFRISRLTNVGELSVKIAGLGLPSFISEVASGIVIILFNTIILKLEGNVGVAAYGIIANISLVTTAIYTGMAQGMQPIVSGLYGEEKSRELIRSILSTLKGVVLISVVIYALMQCKRELIISIFNSEGNKELVGIAAQGMKIYFTAIIFAGLNIVISTFFSATDKSIPAQIISLARGLILIIPITLCLSNLLKMRGIWLSYPVTEGVVTVFSFIYFFYEMKHKNIKK